MTTATPEPEGPHIFHFWGKAGQLRKGRQTIPHPLICHAIDAAVAADLLHDRLLGPSCQAQLADAFAPLGGNVRVWVALLVGLHDLGKLAPAFQSQRLDIAGRYLPSDVYAQLAPLGDERGKTRSSDTFHGVVTAYHILRLVESWGGDLNTRLTLAQVLGGHHGLFFSPTTISNCSGAIRGHGGERWATWVDEFVCQLAQLLGLPDPGTRPWSEVHVGTGAATALAGLTTVSDWVASGSVVEADHAGVDVDLPAYVHLARQRVHESVSNRMRWSAWQPPADTSFNRLFGDRPHPLQSAVPELVAGRTGPGVLVVEAPPGDGKTRIALQSALTLVRQLDLAGFYVALPTRATSNQAFTVTEDTLRRVDPGVIVKLLHGTAGEYLAHRRARKARAEPIRPAEVGGDSPDGTDDDSVREWFTRGRELLSQLAVGTIDRVIKTGIRSRWAPVPLVALSNRVVILDEVHSYEIYMSTILDRLLWWLGWLGVPIILLSATLPATRRRELVHAWYAGANHCHQEDLVFDLPQMPNPGALWVDKNGNSPPVKADPADRNRNRRIGLSQLRDDELPSWALGHASAGSGVVIIHNLVKRVQRTYDALVRRTESLPEPERPRIVQLTAQLPNASRAAVEEELRTLFGDNGQRAPRNGYIVVGTQILEQSLDLDFDAMASDPAPIDSLIQRGGRLHRFRPTSPESPPALVVVGVTTTSRGPQWPTHSTLIYDDAVLLRTWATLREREQLRLPDDAPALVDAVYGEEDAVSCPEGWQARWSKAHETLRRRRMADRRKAETLYLPAPTTEDAFLKLTQHPESTSQTRKPSPRSSRDGR